MKKDIWIQLSLPIGYGKLPTKAQQKIAYERSQLLQTKLKLIGFSVLNPLDFTLPKNCTYKGALDYCKFMMELHKPIMFFDEGYKKSSGCLEEFAYSKKLGLLYYEYSWDVFNRLAVLYEKIRGMHDEYDILTQPNL